MTRILSVCLTLLLVACAGGQSNREPPTPLTRFAPSAAVERVWSADIGRGEPKKFLTLAPFLHGGRLYATDVNGRVSAYAADSGRSLWSTELEEAVAAPVGFGEGLVLIGTRTAHVVALDPDSGEPRWRAAVSSEVLGRPVAASGIVVAQTIDGRLFGLSATDGRRVWMEARTEPSLSLRGTGSPLIVGRLVVAGFANGKLLAAALDTGRPLWERTIGEPRGRNEIERLVDVDAPPAVSGSLVFAASYYGRIMSIEMRNGRILWVRDLSTYSALAVDQANIYLSDAAGNVLAMDQRSGTVLWKQDKLRARLPSAPTLVGDYVAVGDFEGYVHWLSPETGAFAARSRIGGAPIRGPAAVDGDTLFVQDLGGTLAAFRIRPQAP